MNLNATNIHDKNNSNKYVKLLQQFPKIKFSYQLKSYKKVSNSDNDTHNMYDTNSDDNIYFIIPKGKKYFVWFKNDECLFLELDNDKQVINITCKKTSRVFPNDTLLYGTYFYYRTPANNMPNPNIQYYFTIENIHYYNKINLDATHTVFEKCKILHLAFTTTTLEKTFQVEIGLPYINTCIKKISTIKPFYNVFCIQKKKANDNKNQYQNIHYNEELSNIQQMNSQLQLLDTKQPKHVTENKNINNNTNISSKYKIFIVSADIQNDIYHLVDPDSNSAPSSNYHLVASIPDYKTSVMMNSLFRNIKENNYLDALEESDDEEEFENINIDKFVDLTKQIKMKCVYNYKFKKWTPIECVN